MYSPIQFKSGSGMAIVLVLGMLVLIAMLVVAFLSSVSTELQNAKSYASSSDARYLADSAANVVISQIQDATSTPSLAWASQPGMIRTYDSNGDPVAAYKLYSSGTLRIPGAWDPVANQLLEVPANWATIPDVYSDLNAPVTAAGIKHFPIIDASAIAKETNQGAPLIDGETPIEGCYLDTTNPAVAVNAAQSNPIPMPVQWLYVLKDGTLAAMDPVTRKIAGAGAKLADGSENSITGRIAFWTDDETCKINVNTASEGTFWDRPWADGSAASYEKNLNSSSPVQNEFQRYPGHPAMTSLSTVFPPTAAELNSDGTPTNAYKERIYGVIPRVTGGGSLGGTATVTETTKPLVPDGDRLFASVDEFLFGLKIDTGSQTREPNAKAPSNVGFDQDDIAKARFFLTANSKAPEVNLFNKPRISLWPLQANTAKIDEPTLATERNAKDRLIAACSTVGNHPYYFQRYNTFDPTKVRATGTPYNPAALQDPAPSSQSPTTDWISIPRNQELFAYLQSLLRSPVPGLGGTLVGGSPAKYSAPVGDQIITQMFDYVRSYVNTFRSKAQNAVSADAPYYTYAPFASKGGVASGWVTGQGQVVPLVITPPGAAYKTKGFGRFPTITQASLVFYRTDKVQYVPNPTKTKDEPKDLKDGPIDGEITVLDVVPGETLTVPTVPDEAGDPPWVFDKPLNQPKMGAVLLLQVMNVSPGMPPWTSNFRCKVNGLDKLSVVMNGATTKMSFPSSMTNLVNGDANARYYTSTALTDFETFTEYWPHSPKELGTSIPGSPTEEQFYSFYAAPIDLTHKTFDIAGCDISIELYTGYSNPNGINSGDLVQTINMTIPSTDTGGSGLPIPNVPYTSSYSKTTEKTTVSKCGNAYTDFNERLKHPGYNSNKPPHTHRPYIVGTSRGDVVRSVQTRYGVTNGGPGGDFRLVAGLANVPNSFFEGHGLVDPPTDGKSYNDTAANVRLMHSLRAYVATGDNDDKSNGFYANNNNATGLTKANPNGYHARLVAGVQYRDPMNSGGSRPGCAPVAAQGVDGAFMDIGRSLLGDWDTGPGRQIDGPYINKADEATSNLGWYVSGSYEKAETITETGASFSPNRQISSAVAFGSLPSGIDPSSPGNSIPWKTLLFCKNPAAGSRHPGFGEPRNSGQDRPPYRVPPDHAFLDLFTMPIVEPYAISEPFSTSGKVNMNYQILPFTYLTRDTAVRAVLKTTNLMAIPPGNGFNYKTAAKTDGAAFPPPPDFRYRLNLSEDGGTLEGFERRFNPAKFSISGAPDIFRSASEICDIYFVPGQSIGTTPASGNPKYKDMEDWWMGTGINTVDGYKLTGDNVREQPYGHVYPRLTTKSNTYTVHIKAQSLKKARNQPADTFNESRDQVTGEYQGSVVIERTLDPNSDSLVKADGITPATETDSDAMVGPYKYRIVTSKKFAP